MKRARIEWTEVEKEGLIDKVFLMRLNYPCETITILLDRAQQQMPEDRRRNIASVQQIPWMVEGLQAKILDLKTKAAKPTQIMQAPTIVNTISKEEILRDLTLNEMVWFICQRVVDAQNVIATNVGESLDVLRRIESRLSTQTIAMAQKTFAAHIVIVGLEEKHVGKDFARQFPSLRFTFVLPGPHQPEDIPVDATAIFLMTKYVNQKWMVALRDIKGFKAVNGGITQLMQALYDWQTEFRKAPAAAKAS